jgi:hypothetical protein
VSTKIYTAYRLKRTKDFWPFLRDVRRKGVKNVQKELQKLQKTCLDNVDSDSDAYKKQISLGITPEKAKQYIAEKFILEGYRGQQGKSERNPFDFDVTIAVREHKGRLYLIPHCDMLMRKVFDFLKRDPRLEDFCYFNNTDRPKHITQTEWEKRKIIWDAINNTPEGWDDYIVIDICTYLGFWKIYPIWKTKK